MMMTLAMMVGAHSNIQIRLYRKTQWPFCEEESLAAREQMSPVRQTLNSLIRFGDGHPVARHAVFHFNWKTFSQFFKEDI